MLNLHVDPGSNVPMYVQIAQALKDAVASGRLKPRQKLPSSRSLSETLAVSRDTIMRCYELLASQGVITVTARSGVEVNPDCSLVPQGARHAAVSSLSDAASCETARLSEFAQRIMAFDELKSAVAYLVPELNFDAPLLTDLPIKQWTSLLHRGSRLEDAALLSYISDPFGYLPLRQAIAEYLSRCRSIDCSPAQIAIFTNTEGGTDLVCRLLLEPGGCVVVENPGSPGVRQTFTAHGAKIVPVTVDQQGLRVDQLKRLEERVRLVYLTPSHHDPTGAAMSLTRRMELLEWAQQADAVIIEDDFDSEYRYGEKPVAALKALDKSQLVIYRYNFWRALFPLVRTSFVVLPNWLIDPVWRVKSLTERDVPVLEQRALSDFIKEGHLERHIRRTRGLYARRRAALVQAFTRYLKQDAELSSVSAGMHVIVRFSHKWPEERILAAAEAARLPVAPTKKHYVGAFPQNEFMAGFAHVDEHSMPAIVLDFARRLTRS